MRSASILAILLVTVVAACAKPAPEPMPIEEPLTIEPESTGKYK